MAIIYVTDYRSCEGKFPLILKFKRVICQKILLIVSAFFIRFNEITFFRGENYVLNSLVNSGIGSQIITLGCYQNISSCCKYFSQLVASEQLTKRREDQTVSL